MSAYDNDPRVKQVGDEFLVVNSGSSPLGFEWPAVRLHRRDGWAIYEPSRSWAGYSVAGFGSADDAIRYLIGDPQ